MNERAVHTSADSTPELRDNAPAQTAAAGLAGDEPPPAAEDAAKLRTATMREAVTEGIGGVRGMVESTVPVVVFVAVNLATSLKPAVWAAIGVALAIAAYRLVKRDSVRHALTGAFGVAVAAMIAARTGDAADFFVPGIIMNFVYAASFLVSIVIGRPLVGYVWSLVTGAHEDWRSHPALVRAFSILSWVWVGVFLLRGGVQLGLWLADMTVGLGIARILGIAPYAGAVALTVWYGRRAVARVLPVEANVGKSLESDA